jgi:hypothetical protein
MALRLSSRLATTPVKTTRAARRKPEAENEKEAEAD